MIQRHAAHLQPLRGMCLFSGNSARRERSRDGTYCPAVADVRGSFADARVDQRAGGRQGH